MHGWRSYPLGLIAIVLLVAPAIAVASSNGPAGDDEAVAEASAGEAKKGTAEDEIGVVTGSSDMGEMGGGVDVEAGVAWEKADAKLKAAFAKEYDATEGSTRPIFEKYIKGLGAPAMLDYLEEKFPHCHPQAHDLGKSLFAEVQDLNGALRICGNRCTNACMHGVIGEAFGSGGLDSVLEDPSAFCRQGEMARLHKIGNCAHGLGHALMIVNQWEIGKALDGCDRFQEKGLDYYCATGVFMEYENSVDQYGEKAYSPERPSLHYPCDEHTRFSAACYRYNLRFLYYDVGMDRMKVVNECLGLEQPQQAGCFHGLGNIFSQSVRRKPHLLKELCKHGDAIDQIMCIEGAVEKMADYDEELAMRACESLEGDNRKVCDAAAKEKMYRLEKPSMKHYRNKTDPS